MAKSVLENSPQLSPVNPEDEGKRKKRSPAEPVGAEMTAQAVAERAQELAEWNQQRAELATEARKEVEAEIDLGDEDIHTSYTPEQYQVMQEVAARAGRHSTPDTAKHLAELRALEAERQATAKADALRRENAEGELLRDDEFVEVDEAFEAAEKAAAANKKIPTAVERSLAELGALHAEWQQEDAIAKRAEKSAHYKADNERRLAEARAAMAKADAEERARKQISKSVPPAMPKMNPLQRDLERRIVGAALDNDSDYDPLAQEFKRLRDQQTESAHDKASISTERHAKLGAEEAYESLTPAKRRGKEAAKRMKENAAEANMLHEMFESGNPKKLQNLANEHPEWLDSQGAWMDNQRTQLDNERATLRRQLNDGTRDIFERGEIEDQLDELDARERKLDAQFDALMVAQSILGKAPSNLPTLSERTSSVGSVGFGKVSDQSFSRADRDYGPKVAEGPWMQYNPSQKDVDALVAELRKSAGTSPFSEEQAIELAETPIESLSTDDAHTLAIAARHLSETSRGKLKQRYEAMHEALEAWRIHAASELMANKQREMPEVVRGNLERGMDDADMMYVRLGNGEFFDEKGHHLPSEILRTYRDISRARGAEKALVTKANARLKQVGKFLASPAVRNAHLEALDERMSQVSPAEMAKFHPNDPRRPDLAALRSEVARATGRDRAEYIAKEGGDAVLARMAEDEKRAREVSAKAVTNFSKDEVPRAGEDVAPMIEEARYHAGRRPRTPKPFSKAESPEAADAEAVKKLYGQEVWLKRSTGEMVRAVVGVPTEDGRTWMSYMIDERQMGRKAVRNSEILAWQREMEGKSPDHAPEIPDSAFGDLLAEKPAPAPKFYDLSNKLPAPERPRQTPAAAESPKAPEIIPAPSRVPYTEIAPQIAELERELVEAKNTLDALNARLAQAKSGKSRESVTEIETDRAFWQEELRRTTDKLDDAEDDVAEAFTEEFNAQSEMLAERYGFPAEQIEDAAMDVQRTQAMVKRMVAAENAKTKGFFGRVANFFTSGSREKELTKKFHDMNAIAVRAGDAKQRMKELNDYRGRLK
jgi:hypothetical protein